MKLHMLELGDKVSKLFHGIDLRMFDEEYHVPTEEEVRTFCIDSFIDRYKYVKENFDCDDFAWVLKAYVIQERYKKLHKDPKANDACYPWAFGFCCGTKINGRAMHHAVNCCYTSEGKLLIIEPQNDEVREANSEKDSFYIMLF